MSPRSAGLARKMGYTNVKVYVDGEPMWRHEGYYTVNTADFVKTGNVVIIDLRFPDMVSKGHIPRAVNIPAEKLKDAEEGFPSQNAPIIFYSDNLKDIENAVKTVRGWGYKRATVFLGGGAAWTAKGYKLQIGPAATEIRYTRKLEPGEISIPDFEKALKTDIIHIIDVRSPEEYAGGHFHGAINVSLDDLPLKLSEIPSGKFIIVHCKTGVRGEMAYSLLKDRGFAVKYLRAACVCTPDGKYEIWEE
ncbi:MAG: rhodanese-like domain-containing protein [Thermodesulfovibrionales bacterium]|nr:rhodanese-like domain-containing protein [Thermodesulfovibrionales bacterium]